jgi:hypothetical protein
MYDNIRVFTVAEPSGLAMGAFTALGSLRGQVRAIRFDVATPRGSVDIVASCGRVMHAQPALSSGRIPVPREALIGRWRALGAESDAREVRIAGANS